MRANDDTGYRVYGIKIQGSIRYVGATKKNLDFRLRQHLSVARVGKIDRPIYEEMRNNIDNVEVVLLSECQDDASMSIEEQRWVAALPNLLNAMTGGYRGNGSHSEQTREKMRIAAAKKVRTKEHNQHISESNRGRQVTPETRKKISESHTKSWQSEERRKNHSEGQRRRWEKWRDERGL